MKSAVATILIFVSLALTVHAQSVVDTLVQLPVDTLDFSQQKLDSLMGSFQSKADSISNLQNTTLSGLFGEKDKLTRSIDSLTTLNQPADKYIQKKDSIEKDIAATVKKYEAKLSELKSSYTENIDKLNLPPKASEQIDKLTGSIEGFQIPSADVPSLSGNVPGMPDVNIPDVNLNGGQLGDVKLPDGNIPSVEGIGNVQQQVTEAVPGADKLNDLKEVAAVKNVEGATEMAEQKVSEQVKGVAAQSDELSQLTAMTSEDGAKEMMTSQAMEQLPESPINHFAGKEEVLQKAMEDISKLKQKYSSVSSLSEIKKKRPNEMRGKPFIERLKPGIGLQFFGGNDEVLIDLNPYVGYRITRRFTSGLGWNQRVVFNTEDYQFTSGSLVYGPRVYSEYNLWRGFHPRLEIETMNTNVPSTVSSNPTDTQHREWVWGMLLGLKKEYKISSRVNGTAILMFNLFDPERKSPYKDVVNMRIGVEVKLKKKKPKAA